jgi:endonuclease III
LAAPGNRRYRPPMIPVRWSLRDAVSRLERYYGKPEPLRPTDPFGLVLWESCAYLVDDARRRTVYDRLISATGGDPERIAAMKPVALAQVIAEDGGMRPMMRAEKLQQAADLILDAGQRQLAALCRSDPGRARTILKRFPGIGDPGADKILMIQGSLKTLAPESNAARVLCRLGFGTNDQRYNRMYRSVIEATTPELPNDAAWRVKAHRLLRQHGQVLCKVRTPRCGECPLASRCPSAA